ncbi:MAG: glycine cleavage system protein GcvH [Desulfomonilaceae bacterium]
MKEIEEFKLPDDVRYAQTHEWVKAEGDIVRVGITDYAQDQLGALTFVELPNPGDEFRKGEQFGVVESVKAVSELFMPVGGEIMAVNADLAESPELINSDPYGAGWIIEIKPEHPEELEDLVTSNVYREMLGGLE